MPERRTAGVSATGQSVPAATDAMGRARGGGVAARPPPALTTGWMRVALCLAAA